MIEFADWEELGDSSMADWDRLVRKFLNGQEGRNQVSDSILNSESGFLPNSIVETKKGKCELSSVLIGDMIFDGSDWTKVTGKVDLDGKETTIMGKINDCQLSGASWIYDNNTWVRAAESTRWRTDTPVNRLVSIFTETGKFMVGGIISRDFSDIGIKNIEKTYDFTKSRL